MIEELNIERYKKSVTEIQKALEFLQQPTINLSDIRQAQSNIKTASAILFALELSMAGLPEPNIGE